MKNKKNIIYILGGLLILVFCLTYKSNLNIGKGGTYILAVEKINQDMIIEKEFTSEHDSISSIGIKFATYQNNNNPGNIVIKIIDIKDKKEIYNEKISISNILDNQYYMLNLNKELKSKNRKYKITIIGEDIKDTTTLGIWGFDNEKCSMSINGETQTDDFGIVYNAKKGEYQLLLYLFLYIAIILLIELVKGVKPNEINNKN